MITKACRKCSVLQSLDSFKKQKGGRYGLHSWCKTCIKIKDRAWRIKNLEHRMAYNKIRRKTHNEKKTKEARDRERLRSKREVANLEPIYLLKLIRGRDKLLTNLDLREASEIIDLYKKRLTLRRKIYDKKD